jgi:hypothetical protein
MIEIRHRKSGRVLLEVAGETLARANLSGEYLIHADLRGADLAAATLMFANLSGADLSHANLSGANLRGANLTEADMTGADFAGVNLAGATLSLTVFSACRNLHRALGLAHVHHKGPSNMDEATLRASVPHLPDAFLRGIGYTRAEIGDLRQRYSIGEDAVED